MDTNDLMLVAIVVVMSFIAGAGVSFFILGELVKEAPVDSPPPCDGEVYTPGTCGVNSNLSFSQCKTNTTNTTGEI